MGKDIFMLNKLRIAVLFMLFMPFLPNSASAEDWYFAVKIGDKTFELTEEEPGKGHYVGFFEVDNNTSEINVSRYNTTGWMPIIGPEEKVSLGTPVRLVYDTSNNRPTTFADPLVAGKYDIDIMDTGEKEGGWMPVFEMTITKNDGSISEFYYSLNGTEWTKVKAEDFYLRSDFKAGDKLYFKYKYKEKDGEFNDPNTYTYYYEGTVPTIADDDSQILKLTGGDNSDAALTFEEKGKYSLGPVTLTDGGKKASILVTHIGFMPVLKLETLRYSINGGESKAINSQIPLNHGDILSFSIKGTDENGDEKDYDLYPSTTVMPSLGNGITLTTNALYAGNNIKPYYSGSLKNLTVGSRNDNTELVLNFSYEIDKYSDLPQILLFNKNVEPTNEKTVNDLKLEGLFYDWNTHDKSVVLRYDGDMTYSGVIQLTQEDLDNDVLTIAEKADWSWRGYNFPTGSNVILRDEPFFMSLCVPQGQGSSRHGLMTFGSRFTPGVYRVTVKGRQYDQNQTPSDKVSFKVPVSITLDPVRVTYYHVDNTQWRETVGAGIVRKFGYSQAEAEAMGLRHEYQSDNVYIRTDNLDDYGNVLTTYYSGTVDFSDDEGVGTVKVFHLTPTEDADAKINVNGKGQFQMNFNPDTNELTVERTEIYAVPVRSAVTIDGNTEIIMPGEKLTVYVNEPKTPIRFSVNHDMNLESNNDLPDGSETELSGYSAWIYPDVDAVPSDDNVAVAFGESDYQYCTFTRNDAGNGDVIAAQPGYYTFNARVYPKLRRVVIACEYTTYHPDASLNSDFSDAAFANYPYVHGPETTIPSDAVANSSNYFMKNMTTYTLRGDALDYHNEYYADKPEKQLDPLVPFEDSRYNVRYIYDEETGERLAQNGTYARGELVRGNRYLMESVEDLFGTNGIIGCNVDEDYNFMNLVKLRKAEQARAQGRLEAEGGRVSFVVQFTSTSTDVRLCYFYVTREMRQRILDTYRNSNFVTKIGELESFKGIGDDETKEDYLDGLYTKCLMAAINDGVVPGFSVLSNAANRGAVKYLEPEKFATTSNRYVEAKGNTLETIWNSVPKIREYFKANSWIEGARIPLAYFGPDYREEMQQEFPEGTYIYPYIIVNDSGDISKYALPLGGPNEESTDPSVLDKKYSAGKLRFSDNRLNLMSTNLSWQGKIDKQPVQDLIQMLGNNGAPSAMTFNYRAKNLRGQFINLTLVGWEDGGDYDWSDIVLNVAGVKQVFAKPVSFIDFDVTALPVSTDKDDRNNYNHIVSLSPKKTVVNDNGWTMDQFGFPYAKKTDGVWDVEPAYSYVDVNRDEQFIGQIVFLKDICRNMLIKKNPNDPVSDNELHTSLRYFFSPKRLMHVDESTGIIGFINEADKVDYNDKRWVEIFHDSRGDGHSPVDISLVMFNDQFPGNFGEASHVYQGSFYSSSALVYSEPDKVIVPGSALEASIKATNLLPGDEKKATDELPEVLDADSGAPAIVVARNLNLANKEVIKSYSIFDVAEQAEVATVDATIEEGEDGVVTATAWTLEGKPLRVENIDADKDKVYLPGNVITGGKIYTVVVNTDVKMGLGDLSKLDLLSCSYDGLSDGSKFEGKAPVTNTYGAQPAKVDDLNSLLNLEVEYVESDMGVKRDLSVGIRDGVITGGGNDPGKEYAVSYETVPTWTIDLNRFKEIFPDVDPSDVRYYLWRTYKNGTPACEPENTYLSTLFANESMPGQMDLDDYRSWVWAPHDIDLVAAGDKACINDVMVTKFVSPDQEFDAEYVLYAYIPANEAETPETAKTRGYGKQTADTRYYVAKATATVHSQGVTERIYTGVENVADGLDRITVSGHNGVLKVNGARRVNVYSLSGIEVYAAEGDVETALPAGIYVVKADSEVVKIDLR